MPINPAAQIVVDRIRPYMDRALQAARPQLAQLAEPHIQSLPFFKRAIARAVWWPIFCVVVMRFIEYVAELALALRGEIPIGECTDVVQRAACLARDPNNEKVNLDD